MNLLFEVTNGCSASCEYCYARNRDVTNAPPEMLETIARDIAAEVSIDSITLIGGEPLEHPQLVDIAKRLIALGLPLAITTSALLLDDSAMDALMDAGVRTFEVSLDSTNPEVFRTLGRGDDVLLVMHRIAKLVATGASVTVSVVLSRLNHEHLQDLVEFCVAVGVTGMSVLRVLRPGGEGITDSGLAISNDDLPKALLRLDQLSERFGLPIVCSTPIEPCRFPTKKLAHLIFPPCSCGETKWLVDPKGNLRVCELSGRTLGNLCEQPFSELRKLPAVGDFRGQNRHDHCTSCKHLSRCGGGCRFVEEPLRARQLAVL